MASPRTTVAVSELQDGERFRWRECDDPEAVLGHVNGIRALLIRHLARE